MNQEHKSLAKIANIDKVEFTYDEKVEKHTVMIIEATKDNRTLE